jgi:hypothetical protein
MSTTVTQAAITISLTDLENIIRRVVREAMHEELSHLPRAPVASILDDWSQEGPDDPAGDEQLLHEAMAALKQYGDKPETWTKWEDLEAACRRRTAMVYS